MPKGSSHCEEVIKKLEAGEIDCADTKQSRSAVMCSAWTELREKNLTRLPIKESWARLRKSCKKGE